MDLLSDTLYSYTSIPYTYTYINKISIYPTYITYINNPRPDRRKLFVGKDLQQTQERKGAAGQEEYL